MCSGFPTEKIEQMILMSFSDVTVIAHSIGGGKYIRRANSSFGAVVWVSGTEWLGLLLSHQPSTSAISVPLVEQEYILEELFTLIIHVQAPRQLNIVIDGMWNCCSRGQMVRCPTVR